MGIKHLNKYLNENCKTIRKIHLSHLANKIVVVDASIYLYKFLGEDRLTEGIYDMVIQFRTNGIIPVFVFDGKPPPEKSDLITKRNEEKWKAREKYNQMKENIYPKKMPNGNFDSTTENDETPEMALLKKKFIKIKEEHVIAVKELFDIMNVRYFTSTTEADPLCVYLVNSGKAYACLSEDMDMFAYGCRHILRNLNFESHNVTLYCLDTILSELNISQKQFRQILVLCGTDYNIDDNNNLYHTFRLYQQNRVAISKFGLYEWLECYYRMKEDCSVMKNKDKLLHCFEMFELEHYNDNLKDYVSLVL